MPVDSPGHSPTKLGSPVLESQQLLTLFVFQLLIRQVKVAPVWSEFSSRSVSLRL